MTVAFLCALLNRIIEAPDLATRIERGRAVRMALAPLCESRPDVTDDPARERYEWYAHEFERLTRGDVS